MPLAIRTVNLSVVLREGRPIIYGVQLLDLAFDGARGENEGTGNA